MQCSVFWTVSAVPFGVQFFENEENLFEKQKLIALTSILPIHNWINVKQKCSPFPLPHYLLTKENNWLKMHLILKFDT